MNRYALVNKKTSIVDNVTLWDGVAGWSAPTGYTAVQSDTANIGDTYANGVFTAAAIVIVPPTLAESQSAQIGLISMDCGNAITSGFTSSALGTAYTYPSKMTDQTNLIGAYGDSLNPANPSTWATKFWCADSTGAWALRVHAASQIQQVFADGVARKLAMIEQNDLLASQVMAAKTVSAVKKIIWVAP